MASEKPYPHVTVVSSVSGCHAPVMYARSPHGFVQVADRLEDEIEFVQAKREAVSWAKRLNVPYLIPDHD
jgi:hypothetical protein